MTLVKTVLDALDRFAPFSTCVEGDSVGLLVGSADTEVDRVAVALDVTHKTVAQAKAAGCGLLVTHHPAYFGLLEEQPQDSAAVLAQKLGLCIISAHTNLDAARGGVNDVLAELLDIKNIEPIGIEGEPLPMARVGDLEMESAASLACYAGERLGVAGVKYTPCTDAISRVAVCGGSGGDFLLAAKDAGAQALVTGESKHHLRLLARQLNVALIECGHFCTEQPIKKILADIVASCSVKTVMLDECDPAEYIKL